MDKTQPWLIIRQLTIGSCYIFHQEYILVSTILYNKYILKFKINILSNILDCSTYLYFFFFWQPNCIKIYFQQSIRRFTTKWVLQQHFPSLYKPDLTRNNKSHENNSPADIDVDTSKFILAHDSVLRYKNNEYWLNQIHAVTNNFFFSYSKVYFIITTHTRVWCKHSNSQRLWSAKCSLKCDSWLVM